MKYVHMFNHVCIFFSICTILLMASSFLPGSPKKERSISSLVGITIVSLITTGTHSSNTVICKNIKNIYTFGKRREQ
jgi:hypothetical protein